MLLSVAAGAVVYAYFMGWLSDTGQIGMQGTGTLQIDSIVADSEAGTIKLYIRNVGAGTLNLDKIYVGGLAVTNDTVSPAVWTPSLASQSTATLSITGLTLTNSKACTVQVVCSDGTTVSTSVTPRVTVNSPLTPNSTPTPAPTSSPTPTPGLPVDIKFAAGNLKNINGDTVIFTIDGVKYSYSDLSWRVFQWKSGSTHTIVASTPVTAWDNNIYTFSSWINGNGLKKASGTFTVPSADTTVTANYELTTFTVKFTTTGVSNYDGKLLIIDGKTYTYWDLGWQTFLWEAGSKHSVEAITPVKGWDGAGHQFSSWTNGNGLKKVADTFIMPNSAVTVTANYVSSTTHIKFSHTGLSNLDSGVTVLTIDDVKYDYWQVTQTDFQWDIGSKHTVVVSSPITGWDKASHSFSSWTNGHGLNGASGTLTVPASMTATTITVNYKTP